MTTLRAFLGITATVFVAFEIGAHPGLILPGCVAIFGIYCASAWGRA